MDELSAESSVKRRSIDICHCRNKGFRSHKGDVRFLLSVQEAVVMDDVKTFHQHPEYRQHGSSNQLRLVMKLAS